MGWVCTPQLDRTHECRASPEPLCERLVPPHRPKRRKTLPISVDWRGLTPKQASVRAGRPLVGCTRAAEGEFVGRAQLRPPAAPTGGAWGRGMLWPWPFVCQRLGQLVLGSREGPTKGKQTFDRSCREGIKNASFIRIFQRFNTDYWPDNRTAPRPFLYAFNCEK